MSDSRLSVAFLWHMHQPYYRDPFTGVYRLPWVRLHGTKDYLDMAVILRDYPEVRQTFNLVPSLLEQLIDYTDHGATDIFLDATLTPAADLTAADRAFLLGNFFLANWDTMVRPFPRYHELLVKRGLRFAKTDAARVIRYFTNGDFRDLQVLFNLAWIDPVFRDADPFLNGLVQKGRDFTEEEKALLVERQYGILRQIIPAYRELLQSGRIELSTTPFYHPILPLVWDTDIAKVPSPDLLSPRRRFSRPEDARHQVRSAIGFFEDVFGRRPEGMWPSEGAVSEDVVRAIGSEGISWVATDEDILAASLRRGLRTASGGLSDPSVLYSAHEFSGVSMIFRDHRISDLLGFVYSGWDPKAAAHDLIAKLNDIERTLSGRGPHIVPIILDGENAWEHYRDDGRDFFRYLYEGLSKSGPLSATTISGFLKNVHERRRLEHLAPGSWIYGNFRVWIGHEEDNTSWDHLTEAREHLESFRQTHPDRNLDAAWKSIYVAEGSDWNWWYGDEHSTELAEEFDELYRLNLMKVYRETGREAPPHLSIPVLRSDRGATPAVEIRGFINPAIDGIMTSYFEWYQGAHMDVGKSGGSMHIAESLISRIYYGFNQETLFVRIDPKTAFSDFPDGAEATVRFVRPAPFMVTITLYGPPRARLFSGGNGEWVLAHENLAVAVQDILECAIPFRDIKAAERDELHFFITVTEGGAEIERCPLRGYITVTVPTPDFEAMMWQ